ncbi:MAG: hypothetical protein ABI588_01130, partial [Arenimonas sp.]
MNLAAYLAWAAIGTELWAGKFGGTGLIPAALLWPLLIALHLGFLALFLARQLLDLRDRGAIAAVAAQFAVAIAMAMLSRESTVPILLVVAAAQLAQLLPVPVLAVVWLATNALMYWIYRELWSWTAPAMATLLHGSFQLFAMVASWYAVTSQRARDALATAHAELLATRSLLAES